jgi:gliding motility-associated-like protein
MPVTRLKTLKYYARICQIKEKTMNNYRHGLILFFSLFTVSYLHAQIDRISFDHKIDDLASYHVNFKSYYHPSTGSSPGTSFSLSDTVEYGFSWQFGDGNSGTLPALMHRYSSAGTYLVTLTLTGHYNALSLTFEDYVEVGDTFEVPNVFTPDGDGINDNFIVRSNGSAPLTITIFDRTGNTVYRHTSLVISWDGRTPAGTRVSPGVYYYVITSPEPLYNKNGFVHIFYNN